MGSPLPPFTAGYERRAAALEVRASGRRLAGYAATFGQRAKLGRFEEQLAPGAFRASLDGRDIVALVDHDRGKVLGRTASGSLRLSQDSRGLAFELDLPDTQAARDVLALATRGDLGGMSFGFTVPEGGESWRGNLRTLNLVELREISVISAWPAYPETSVSVRALDRMAEAERRRRALRLAELMPWA
jgi:HK97 family phage prohead protease